MSNKVGEKKRFPFIAFVIKEFYHILRDKRTMLILLVMPVVLIVLLGFALSLDIKNVNVGILNPSDDNLVRQMSDKLNSSEYFNIVCQIDSPDEIENIFRKGKVDVFILFGPDFSSRLLDPDGADVQLVTDASESNMAQNYNTYISGIMGSAQREFYNIAMDEYGITPNVKFLYNPQMKSSFNFVPGVMGFIMMLICAMMTSVSIVREKERGTMEVLLVSPVKAIYIVISKMVPYFVLSCFNLGSILLLSFYLLEVPIGGSLFWLVIVSLLYIFVSLSLGLLISSIAQNQVTAILVSGMLLIMPSLILSGMLFPIESMPKILQWVSAIVPPRWYIEAVRKLMIEGVSVKFVLNNIAVMSGMLIVLMGVSLKKFKYRLE